MDEKRRLDHAFFGVREFTPFVAWKYEGDIGESRRDCTTIQEAQDAYNEMARSAQTYGIVPTHEPVSAHLCESVISQAARIASLEAQLREREAECADLNAGISAQDEVLTAKYNTEKARAESAEKRVRELESLMENADNGRH